MKTIKVHRLGGLWQASFYVDGAPDPTVEYAFGTHTLPTPWAEQASGEQVRANVASLNPGVEVTLERGAA